ncbi:hypothetical protein FRC01_002192 [Tulasnella sp. 417]|nr:hypothetical protein FRC01_002192 [Tulasnella sp. 417]
MIDGFNTSFIVESCLIGLSQIIVMQTPFMAHCLIKENIESWKLETHPEESGRHGFVTDGAHKFWQKGLLATTCSFSSTLKRWVPVVFSWMGTQDTNTYAIHFYHLFRIMAEEAGTDFVAAWLSNVADFSDARRQGAVQAFVRLMCQRNPSFSLLGKDAQESERARLKKQAEELVQGCHMHWSQSKLRIVRILPEKQRVAFYRHVTQMEETTSRTTFTNASTSLLKEVPDIKGWIDWWLVPEHASMIFPAVRKMSSEDRNKLPTTSNAAEGLHWQVYRGVGKSHDLVPGIRALYLFCRGIETMHDSVQMGAAKPRFDGHIAPESGSDSNMRPENDGRAPDTRALLERASAASGHLSLEAPTDEQLAALPPSRYEPKKTRQLPGSQTKRKAQTLEERILQSYAWSENSCYIDCSAELLFRAYTALRSEDRAELHLALDRASPNKSIPSGFYVIASHWEQRLEWITNPASKKTREDAIDRGQIHLRSKKQSPPNDKGEQIDNPIEVQKLMAIHHTLIYMCDNGHRSKDSEPPQVEHETRTEDVRLAHSFSESGESSLSTYYSHIIPRSDQFRRTHEPLHLKKTVQSACESCGLPLVLRSIKTDWPMIWRFSEQYQEGIQPLQVTRKIQIQSSDGAVPVEYKVIGRSIFNPESSHFTSQVLLNGRCYHYDDMENGGHLQEVGAASLGLKRFGIGEAFQTVSFMFTTRTATAIIEDLARIRPQDIKAKEVTIQESSQKDESDDLSGQQAKRTKAAKGYIEAAKTIEDELTPKKPLAAQAQGSSLASIRYPVGTVFILPLNVNPATRFGPARLLSYRDDSEKVQLEWFPEIMWGPGEK